jgi:serine protease Do
VLAVGNPFGLNSTVTLGIVSALGRGRMGITQYEDFIQTDAAINPGNSGGALVNTKGELVGINTAIFSQSGGYQGVGFAVPTSMGQPIYDSLVKHGKVVRGYLGIGIQDLNQDLAPITPA